MSKAITLLRARVLVQAGLASLILAACGGGSISGVAPSPPGDVAPAITTQPTNQTVTAPATASFSVVASGTAPLTYQWQRNGAAISGATAASYTTPATLVSDSGAAFSVVVSNSAGSVTSDAATLTVTAVAVAPAITTQPSNQTVTAPATASFTVAASGSSPLSYQWRRNGTAISGATAARYTTPATAVSDSGASFSVVVSNSAGSVTSNAATLTVNASAAAPAITTQPANQTVTAPAVASFSVAASGAAPLAYQWQRNGAAISGATAASYTTPATTTSDNGARFSVVVSNTLGSVTSNAATLTVTAAAVAPTITTQPANQSVTAPSTATFTVAASGTAPLTYQWRRNGTAISGATAASYTTPATAVSDSGQSFSVVISNAVGSVTSNAATLTVTAPPVAGTVNVTTYHNDNARTGQNLQETLLTTANVNAATFGRLNDLKVDGKVDAQPLYLSALTVNGAKHNVLYVVTEHDSVYAFDADSGAILWQRSMLQSGETTSDARNCDQVINEIGITATPVIDRAANAIYLIAMSKTSSGSYFQRLHALNLSTGAEVAGGPKDIAATYPGTGDNSAGGVLSFDPGQYKDRMGLVLLNGTLYTSWSSHCDIRAYTGWIIAYNPATLAQTAVLNITPNGSEGGMWSANGAPAVDAAGNLYILAGNGTFDTTLDGNGFPNQQDFGNAYLKISTAGGKLAVADYFAMFDTISESAADADLGSGGAIVLPDLRDASGTVRHLTVGAGKDKRIYLLDRDNMGKFNPSDNSGAYQVLDSALSGPEFGTPAYFNGSVYYGAVNDSLKAYPISNARLATTPSTRSASTFAYPGATVSISANGSSNGIVWAIEPRNGTTLLARLHAYDAADLGRELYNSDQAAANRDSFTAIGNKFIVPTIANGKVYIGTTNSVTVFGLLP